MNTSAVIYKNLCPCGSVLLVLKYKCDMIYFTITVGFMQMSVWNAVILGLVQGITEFLPVSSSGHLSMIN